METDIIEFMNDNNNNEGMVNNSNQPSQTEKLNGMINKKITDLTEQLGKIGSEINELKQISIKELVKIRKEKYLNITSDI